MLPRSGWTLVELLIVIAIVAMLVAFVLPSLSLARDRARLLACGIGMRDTHQALMGYAGMNDRRLPPFRFSSLVDVSLPLSGHWGGISRPEDPVALFKGVGGMFSVNLWVLVDEGFIEPERLICPSAPTELRDGRASQFPYTLKFSTYCLRFPHSADLFREARGLAGSANLLAEYAQRRGGERVPRRNPYSGMQVYLTVPQVRVDRRYRITAEVACGDGEYDVAADVMLSDMFWYQDRQDASASSDGQTYPVRSAWSHGPRFNAITGAGAVRTSRDDGTKVRPFTNAPGEELPDDGYCGARYAERVWQFLDGRE